MRIKSPLAYPGSKSRYAEKIVKHLAVDHTTYVESHCATLSVLLAKPPSKCEIANDIDGEFVNFFEVVSSRTKLRDLKRKLRWAITHEEIFNQLKAYDPTKLFPVDRAFRLLYLDRLAFGSRYTDKFAIGTGGEPRFDPRGLIDRVDKVHARISNVHFLNRDFYDLVKTPSLNKEDALWYIDPPYYETTTKGYGGEPLDLRQFYRACRSLLGRVVISHNDHPRFRARFRGWHSMVLDIKASQLRGGTGPRKHMVEMLFSNKPFDHERLQIKF